MQKPTPKFQEDFINVDDAILRSGIKSRSIFMNMIREQLVRIIRIGEIAFLSKKRLNKIQHKVDQFEKK